MGLFQQHNARAIVMAAPRERRSGPGVIQSSARLLGQSIGARSDYVVSGPPPLNLERLGAFARGWQTTIFAWLVWGNPSTSYPPSCCNRSAASAASSMICSGSRVRTHASLSIRS
jgi:hypothetical protein